MRSWLWVALVLCFETTATAQVSAPWMSRAVEATCFRLAREAEAALRAAAPPRDRRNPLHYTATPICHDAGNGAWFESVRTTAFEPGPTLQSLDGFRVLRFITPDGAVLEAPREALGEYVEYSANDRSAVGDFDGDGRAEFAYFSDNHDAPAIVLSARTNTIARLTFPPNVAANYVDDVDRDGRLDLLQQVHYAVSNDCPRPPALDLNTPVLQWVALNNDSATLVTDSDETRAFVRLQCPERPTILLPSAAPSTWNATTHLPLILRRFACARAWGSSPSDIEAMLPRVWPEPLRCHPRTTLVAFAASIRPPFTLRPLASIASTPTAARADAPSSTMILDRHQPVLSSLSLRGLPPSIATHCRRRSRAMSAFLDQIDRGRGDSLNRAATWLIEAGECHHADAPDAWVDQFDLSSSLVTGEIALRGRSRIEFVGVRGVVAGGWTPVTLYPGPTYRWRIAGAFDFDHDGHSEAIATQQDATAPMNVSILSARGNAIERYRPSVAFRNVAAVTDVDDDGQWDLLIDSDAAISPDHQRIPPDWRRTRARSFVAHGLRDGTFSLTDAVATEWLRSQCPRAPDRLVTFEDSRNGPEIEAVVSGAAVTCARLHGVSAERLVQRIWTDARGHSPWDIDQVERLMYAAVWRPVTTIR